MSDPVDDFDGIRKAYGENTEQLIRVIKKLAPPKNLKDTSTFKDWKEGLLSILEDPNHPKNLNRLKGAIDDTEELKKEEEDQEDVPPQQFQDDLLKAQRLIRQAERRLDEALGTLVPIVRGGPPFPIKVPSSNSDHITDADGLIKDASNELSQANDILNAVVDNERFTHINQSDLVLYETCENLLINSAYYLLPWSLTIRDSIEIVQK